MHKRREVMRLGQEREVEPAEVEDALAEILDSIHRGIAGDSKGDKAETRLILTVFDFSSELRYIPATYPQILRYFDGWVDVQHLVKNASPLAGTKLKPSLMDCMIALGFGDDSRFVHRGVTRAASTSVRIMAVVVHLLRRPSGAPVLPLELTRFTWRNTDRKRQLYRGKLFAGRPKPAINFPFAAKITLGGSMEAFSDVSLLEYFADYEPTAVGVRRRRMYSQVGYVCLPSVEVLERFGSKRRSMDGLSRMVGFGKQSPS